MSNFNASYAAAERGQPLHQAAVLELDNQFTNYVCVGTDPVRASLGITIAVPRRLHGIARQHRRQWRYGSHYR